jgi:hypothetical protein
MIPEFWQELPEIIDQLSADGDGLEYIATWNAAMFDIDDITEAFTAGTENRDTQFPDHRPFRDGL